MPRQQWLVTIQGLVFVLLLGVLSIGCGKQSQAIEIVTGHMLVEPSTFLRLTPGMSTSEAKEMSGTSGRHEFTYLKDGVTYVLSTYFIGSRPETESGIAFFCLFGNDALIKVLRSLPNNMERYPYRGTTASRPKTWRLQDESRILEVLDSPGLSMSEIAAVIDKYSQPINETQNLPPGFLKAFQTPAYESRMLKSYERNLELLQQFDGHRIKIGMTRSEVDALLGDAAHFNAVNPKLAVSIYAKKIYGDDREEDLMMTRFFRFSPVATVFEDNKVTRVYSRGFISRDWMPGGIDFDL